MNVKYSSILLFTFLLFVACKNPISSENESIIDFPDATNIILEMGSGINLGNVFDLGAHKFDFYELATIITIYEFNYGIPRHFAYNFASAKNRTAKSLVRIGC